MKATIVLMAISVAAFSGCVDSESGSASFYVKDAPTDEFDEIHVVFSKIMVHKSGGTNNETDNETGNETDNETASGWITVYENATGQDVDLLNASGSKAVFLGEADLETGKYTQIRIYAQSAYGVQGGELVPFDLPNGVLKVVKSFDVVDGETRVVIDFDLDKSVKQAGGQWKMTPVIGKTYAQEVDSEESGEEVHEEGEIVELDELQGA